MAPTDRPGGRAKGVRLLAAAAVTALVIVAPACGSAPDVTGGDGEADPPEDAPAGADDAEAAARGLVRAWQDGDRETAGHYGTEGAVEALFESKEPPDDVAFVHCLPGDVPTERECLFDARRVSLRFVLRPTPEGGWAAVTTRFVP